jgi:Tol biopolymer transport system component
MRPLRMGVCCLFVLLISSLPAQTSAPDVPGPSKAWKLAFVRKDDLWVANGDGTGQHLLIHHATQPCWSPDRKRIAFARDNNVWIANADGTQQRQLTFQWHKNQSPDEDDEVLGISWDPKDNSLVFGHAETFTVQRSGMKAPVDSSILREQKEMNPQRSGEQAGSTVEGSSLFRVSSAPGRTAVKTILDFTEQGAHYAFSNQDSPAWSRNGTWLAFARNGDIWTRQRLHEPGPEGEAMEITRLAAPAEFDDPNSRGSRTNMGVARLSWSPNERMLLYGVRRLDGSGIAEIHLLTLRIDGDYIVVKAEHCLTNDGFDACFSPDGRWIAYHCWTGDSSIFLLSPDGNTRRRLIRDADQPAW